MSLLKIFQFRFFFFSIITILVLSGATLASAQSPDLITQNLTVPGSITQGQPVTFSGEVKNLASATTSVWSQVGNGVNVDSLGASALTALNGTDVALFDLGSDFLRTYRFDGTSWSKVGSNFGIPTNNPAGMATLNGTDVAFESTKGAFPNAYEELRTYRFNGTNWSQVGNGLVVPTGFTTEVVAALNGTDVVRFGSQLRTYRFDGTNWSPVGIGLTLPFNLSGYAALTALNSNTIAFIYAIDAVNVRLSTYRFNGTNWSQIGNSLTLSNISRPSIAALNSTDVAYFDSSLGQVLQTYRFNGVNWLPLDNGVVINDAQNVSIARLSTTSVAFFDTYNKKLRTYRLIQGFSVDSGSSTSRFCIDSLNSAGCLNGTSGTPLGEPLVTSLTPDATQLLTSIPFVVPVGWNGTTHTLYFCADVGFAVSELSENNNCTSIPFTVGVPAQPNLTITAFSVPNGFPGSVVSASVTVENNGGSPATAFEVGIHRNKPTGMTCALETYARIVSSLAAGVATTVPISVTLPPFAASYTASAMVDSDCVITESNESTTDNTKQTTYTTVVVVGIKPDLTAGMPFDPGVVSAGVSLAFMGPITNAVGAGDISGSFNNLFQLDIDNDGGGVTFDVNLNAPTSIAGLSAGETKTTLPSDGWVVLPGTHAVRLCADLNSAFTGTIIESNEANNCGPTTVFTVGVPSLPDLTITSFTIPNGLPNAVVSASVTVQNSGTAAVGSFEVGINRNKPTGMTCALETYARIVSSLAAGVSQTVSIPIRLPLLTGSYTASAMVDSDCVITESNETATDNTRQASYVVSAAGASVGAVSPQSNDRETSSRSIFRLLWSVITGKE